MSTNLCHKCLDPNMYRILLSGFTILPLLVNSENFHLPPPLVYNCSEKNTKIICPSPIRPQNVLGDNLAVNGTEELEFILLIYTCQTGDLTSDLFFGESSSQVNQRRFKISSFTPYDQFKYCPNECSIMIVNHLQWNIEEFKNHVNIYLQCDTRLSNCSAVKWNCSRWNQDKSKKRILTMLEDIFSLQRPQIQKESSNRPTPIQGLFILLLSFMDGFYIYLMMTFFK